MLGQAINQYHTLLVSCLHQLHYSVNLWCEDGRTALHHAAIVLVKTYALKGNATKEALRQMIADQEAGGR